MQSLDILAIEGVQRRFTRLIPGMAGLSYELNEWSGMGLYLLEFRMRGDLIEGFILNTFLRDWTG